MSVTKQLIINCLAVPEDILEIIKGYCFYDSITARSIVLKKAFLKTITNSYTQKDQPGSRHDWPPCYYLFGTRPSKDCLMADIYYKMWFCLDCGNYIEFSQPSNHIYASDKVKCKCPFIDRDDYVDPNYEYEYEDFNFEE
jgi:hypothetical protein